LVLATNEHKTVADGVHTKAEQADVTLDDTLVPANIVAALNVAFFVFE
jgi:hypothetical protein